MPIYEYECTSCHHHFDLMQKINDEPVKQCPECYRDTVVKLISAAGFQLKGTGWYATDFKNKTSKPQETPANKDDVVKKTDKSSDGPPSSTSTDNGDKK